MLTLSLPLSLVDISVLAYDDKADVRLDNKTNKEFVLWDKGVQN